MLLERLPPILDKNVLIEADLLCCIIFECNIKSNSEKYYGERWLPLTYLSQNHVTLYFFNQLVSKRHFEKVKGVLGVETPQEFAAKLSEEDGNNGPIARSYRDLIDLKRLIRPESIATER